MFFGESYDILYKELNAGAQIREASSLCVCVCVCEPIEPRIGKERNQNNPKISHGYGEDEVMTC